MKKYITFRDKSAKHMQDFKSTLENTNWGLSDINDSNEMYNSFLNKYVLPFEKGEGKKINKKHSLQFYC